MTAEYTAFGAVIGQSETIMPRSRSSYNQGISDGVYVVISFSNRQLAIRNPRERRIYCKCIAKASAMTIKPAAIR
jgi:hypothetical protein